MKNKIITLIAIFTLGFFVIPHVYAEEIEFGEVTDATKDKGNVLEGFPNVVNSGTNKDAIFIYDSAKLSIVEKNAGGTDRPIRAAWIGIKVEEPTKPTISGDSWSATYSYNGGVAKPFEKDKDGYFLWTAVTEDKLKRAIEGNGNIEFTYAINWTKGSAKGTQNITVKINAKNLELVDLAKPEGSQTVWSEEIATEYVKTLENQNKIDIAPKTGDSFPLALTSIIILMILSGTYAYKQVKE